MNIERLLSMVVRQIFRRLLNKGIGAGMNAASKGFSNKPQADQSSPTQQDQLPPDQQQAAKLAAKRARKAARLGKMR